MKRAAASPAASSLPISSSPHTHPLRRGSFQLSSTVAYFLILSVALWFWSLHGRSLHHHNNDGSRPPPQHYQETSPSSSASFSSSAPPGSSIHLPSRPGGNASIAPTLTVALISNNREASLRRLCDSLLAAQYDVVQQYFTQVNLVFNLEASSSKSIMAYARAFEWPHGTKTLRKRTRVGGLIVAVSESWYPASDLDYGCLLEDDIEVSPRYFEWITKVLTALQKTPDPRVVGISLYSPRLTETTNPKRPFDSTQLVASMLRSRGYADVAEETPYMLQTPCSWGAVYFPVRRRCHCLSCGHNRHHTHIVYKYC